MSPGLTEAILLLPAAQPDHSVSVRPLTETVHLQWEQKGLFARTFRRTERFPLLPGAFGLLAILHPTVAELVRVRLRAGPIRRSKDVF